ncbi:MAG: PspA/IM30 family protein, partial [Lysobacteraceae bacterium]
MAIWSKLFTLGRAGANEAATAVVDANALRILDQEIRDADKAQGKARDDLAGLVARRRILETEVESFRAQAAKYESSARIAMEKG